MFQLHERSGVITAKATRRRWLRVVNTVSAVMFGAIPVAAVTGWMMFQHRPGWYRPAVLGDGDIRRAQRESSAMADSIGDRMVQGRPFDIELSDRALTEWLAAGCLLFEDRLRIEALLSQPAIAFTDHAIRIGGVFRAASWQAVVGTTCRVELTDGGRFIRISVVKVHGGSLPAPRMLLNWLGKDVERQFGRLAEAQSPWLSELVHDVHSVDDLFAGRKIPNRFTWPNGHRSFRIARLDIQDGKAQLRIEPL